MSEAARQTSAAPPEGGPAALAGARARIIRRRRISLTVTLAVGLGALMLVSVTTVLAIGLWSGRANTLSLLSDKAEIAIASAIGQIDQHLMPAEHQVRYVANLIASRDLDTGDRAHFGDVLVAALAAAPQIRALVFIDAEYQLMGAERVESGTRIYTADYSGDEAVREGVAEAESVNASAWGEPLWRPRFDTSILNLRQPVRHRGKYLGILVAAVSINELSEYLAQLSTVVGDNAFILYDRTRVLAHGNMIGGYPGLSLEQPLPALEGFSDPVLAAIWRPQSHVPLVIELPEGMGGHGLDVFNTRYVFIYRELTWYGPRPWQVGSYFRAEDIGAEMRRLQWSAAAGIATLVLSCLAAVILARNIARPITRLALSASRIGKLEISEVEELPASRFRELDDQATAFNAMLQGLRWFETYVPRALVRRLIGQGEDEAIRSVEREVTVMFTDIAGFTGLSEGKPAPQVAAFLNEHFALIGAEVEAESGTVDKFIGDSVMAFWGAPERQPDHARRGARAALAIAAKMNEANRRRAAEGAPPVRARIGLHSGPVTVGNIGAPGRINYTIVGDTVNVAQRLEQLGKEVADEAAEVTILASDTTAAALGPDFAIAAVGSHRLPGRKESIAVFRLG